MRKPLLIITGLLTLLGITVVVHQLTPLPLPLPAVPPQEQQPEEPLFSDPILPAEDVTTRGFQSGGLGLSRSAWEVLRGKQPKRVGEWFLYQGQTCAVFYQQGIVWQLKCTWKRPGANLSQVRTRARRYLPLDSRHQYTLTATAETVVEQYFSQTLGQLLAQTAKSNPRLQPSLGQQGTYTVTYTLAKEQVIGTLFQIGSGTASPAPLTSPE
jgi:hypothetical protein